GKGWAGDAGVIFICNLTGNNWRTQMWDERYSTEEYAYGTKPNEFLEANYKHIPKGRVLSLAEGEGRNAVFLAQQGYEVTAVDASSVGINKAKKLAEANNVSVE